MREPDWIEHDRSGVCPVPAGHDVEREHLSGAIYRSSYPQSAFWYYVIRYRDWTAFEQQRSAGVVPDWARKRARELLEAGDPRSDYRSLAAWIETTFARYIAAHEGADAPKLLTKAEWRALKHERLMDRFLTELRARNLIAPEPEPVDPLAEAVKQSLEAWREALPKMGAYGFVEFHDFMAAELRARGATMEKNNG